MKKNRYYTKDVNWRHIALIFFQTISAIAGAGASAIYAYFFRRQ